MCGIAGFLSFQRSPFTPEERAAILKRMGRALAHRGPDDEQFYDDGLLSLVFRRLSIVDLAGGQQPIFNETRDKLIVANGEIYNHAALRRTLTGHQFATGSDCEVPLHLVEEHGIDGLARLNGMFALALWDLKAKRLLLARDRMGIKPLYVCVLPDGVLFASELKALLCHPRCPREVEWSALDNQANMHRAPVTTFVRGVRFLAGGEWLEAQADGSVREGTYWRIEDYLGTAPFGADARAYRERFRDLVEEATLDHLLSDVPLSLHLSGGIDSSLLAGIIGRSRHDVACYTLVEQTTYRAGDVEAAGRVARALDLPWHPVLLDYRNLLDDIGFDLERLEQSVHMMDSPRFDVEWIFKEELHRYVRGTNPAEKVTLLGQGADEFAGGYSKGFQNRFENWSGYLSKQIDLDLRVHDAVRRALPDHLRTVWGRRGEQAGSQRGPYHEKMRLLTRQLQFFNLWHEDRTSSSQSIEARVPFLDHRLVELLASVPAELHEELFWDKRIVRDALAHFLPEYDSTRPKVGFVAIDDLRTINMIVYDMALRVAEPFRAKYFDDPDLALDRASMERLMHAVRMREGDFYHDAWRLMECMVVAIFDRQCRDSARTAADFSTCRRRPSQLVSIREEDWDGLRTLFSSEPRANLSWASNERFGLPPGAEVATSFEEEGMQKYILLRNNSASAHLQAPANHPWLGQLLRNLGRGLATDFTVQDWIDEFEVPPPEFVSVLNILYSAGFVVRGDGSGAGQHQ